jgi:uncharacterized protein YbaP (TraB family)
MIGSWIRRTAAALLLSIGALVTSFAPASARAPARPALWSVADADTTIYLFGTIHMLPQGYQWRTSRFDQAAAGSQQLIVETIVDENNPHEMLQALTSLAFSPNVPPLANRVPPQKRQALEAAIKKTGLPRASFDKMETWAAAFMLLGTQFREMGLKTSAGVETTLRNQFGSQGKTVGQLESNREQLGFFDALPESAQVALLEGAIEAPVDTSRQFEQMVGAWSRGDVDAIARTFNEELAATPDLREVLIKRRNANWAAWVRQRLASPGAVMVAVGAGHLAGPDSLIALLRRGGYQVKRLQ